MIAKMTFDGPMHLKGTGLTAPVMEAVKRCKKSAQCLSLFVYLAIKTPKGDEKT